MAKKTFLLPVSPQFNAALTNLQSAINYWFEDITLLERALTHSSKANDHHLSRLACNERLEFLGDAVLDLVLSEQLLTNFVDWPEGQLTRQRAAWVNQTHLAGIARALKLEQSIQIGNSFVHQEPADIPDSILADALEAVLAAVYLDSPEQQGLSKVSTIINGWFKLPTEHPSPTLNAHSSQSNAASIATDSGIVPSLENATDVLTGQGNSSLKEHTASLVLGERDPKTKLQEVIRKQHQNVVHYHIEQEAGPDHDRVFLAAVYLETQKLGEGRGTSKKKAEIAAAEQALKTLVIEGK